MIPVEGLPLVAAYAGSFGAAQAERLLWRAGFGPRKGEAEALAKLGLAGAVHALTNPGRENLVGAAPAGRQGPRACPVRRVGTRPRVVARPHGAHIPPAGRAHDTH